MNKKILIISLLAVFMLVVISFASAVSSNETFNVEKKESPLYGLRTRRAIGEKINNIIENIKAKFLGERIFWLPFQLIKREQTSKSGRYLSIIEIFCKNAPCTEVGPCTSTPHVTCYCTFHESIDGCH